MAYRGLTSGSAFWNELLSGNIITYQLVYVELGDPTQEEIRLTNAFKNITMPGYTFTFVDTDTFDILGQDVTSFFSAGKRLKFIDGSSVYYGTVDSSSFSTDTTVEVTMEGGDNLTSTIDAVYRTQSGDLEGIYQAAGGLLSISSFEETLQLTVNELSLSLDGVSGVAIADLLLNRYLDRRVKVWQGLMDSSGVPIQDTILLIDGRILGANVSDNPEEGVSKVTIKAASQWADFERTGGSRTNDRDQQRHYPGDVGFEYAASSKYHMFWGRDGQS